jgi:hypothetical protein
MAREERRESSECESRARHGERRRTVTGGRGLHSAAVQGSLDNLQGILG